MILIFLAVSFFASLAGAICGIGGGVIIKPVLDSLNILNVTQISFLSGCTVLSMSCVSVFKGIKSRSMELDVKTVTPLAIGAVIGGLIGKGGFQYLKTVFDNDSQVGLIQSLIMVVITICTIVFTLKKSEIKTYNVKSNIASAAIGVFLGVLSTFLGIGGGPVNIVVLVLFFSMQSKTAAASSLYIILFSQAASLIQTIVTKTIPDVQLGYFVIMVAGGILGGQVGSGLNKLINNSAVDKLFIAIMFVLVFINAYNVYFFAGI